MRSALKSQTSRTSLATGWDRRAVNTALLAFGNVTFVVAVVAAHLAPVSGYDVDIYRSTPPLFWVGIGIALAASVAVVFRTSSRLRWWGGLVLSSLSVFSVAALPLLRGYFFYGLSDSVRHLGAARRLVTGTTSFFDILYPAGYSFSGVVATLSGIPLERAMLFVMLTVFVLYVVFVVLSVRVVLSGRRAVAVATFAGLLFLPLNHVSLHPHFHTYSMTTFFTPVFLFVLFKHLTAETSDPTIPWRLSSTDLGLAVLGLAIVFYHPQVAMNVIVILGTIAVAQFASARYRPDSVLSRSPPVYGQLLFLLVVFFAWNLQHQAIYSTSTNLLTELTGLFLGTAQGGEVVSQRVESAQAVGLSVGELFVKLFLVPAAFCLLALGTVVVNFVTDYFDEDTQVVVTALTVSGVVFSLYAVAHFVGDVSGYFFRHLGFGMVLVTILGVIGLAHGGDVVDAVRPSLSRSVRGVAAVGLVLALALSLVVVYPSPYIAQPTEHVPDQEYAGHQTVLDHRVDGAALASPRASPRRYATASGTYLDPRLAWGVPSEALPSDLRRYRGDDFATRDFYYYIQSELDRERELVAYRGLRYDEADFEGVGETPGVSRVVSNGELDVYYVEYGDGPVIGDPRARVAGDQLAPRGGDSE